MIKYHHSRCPGQENLCYFRGITKSFYNQKNYTIHSIFSILLRKKKRIHIEILGKVPNTKHLLLNFLLFSRLVNAITIIILLIIIINYCNNYNYHYKQIKHPFSARNIFLWYFLEHTELNLAKEKVAKYSEKHSA